MTSDILIVGAGEAGTRAALAARAAGHAGAVTLVGEEPHAPYERPPLSKPAADGAARAVEIASRERLAAAGVDYLEGRRATAIDRAARRVRLGDGTALGYTRLLLAAGARARRLPAALDPEGRARTLRTRADAEAIYAAADGARRAVLVGAGLIGLELAAVLRARGLEVTVLEAGERALARAVPAAHAERLVARHRDAGTRLVFGTRIERVDAEGVTLADGERVAAELVVAAIGAAPETALAESAGLAVGDGVHVDAALATSDPAVLAAGDCAAIDHPRHGRLRLEHWQGAVEQGELAGRALAGESIRYEAVPWFWSDQHELGLQVAGLPDARDVVVERRLDGDASVLFGLGADGRLGWASGLGPGNAVAKTIRLASLLIARGVAPDPAALADPKANLKGLARG